LKCYGRYIKIAHGVTRVASADVQSASGTRPETHRPLAADQGDGRGLPAERHLRSAEDRRPLAPAQDARTRHRGDGGRGGATRGRGNRAQEEKILARFNQDRNEAYQEFLEQCEGFEAEIAKERAAGKFTFAELEENDEDLRKLRRWFEKIRKLDFHGASLAGEAAERLSQCEALLDTFAKQVFEAQDENRSPSPGAASS
jgi:Protein ChrB, N-terminal